MYLYHEGIGLLQKGLSYGIFIFRKIGGEKMRKNSTKNLVLAGLFIALGVILPFFTGKVGELGRALLPMHIPVLIAGFVCGWPYGFGGWSRDTLSQQLYDRNAAHTHGYDNDLLNWVLTVL